MGIMKKQKATVINCATIADCIVDEARTLMVEDREYNLNIFAPNSPDNESYIKGIKRDAKSLGIGTCERSCENWEPYIHDGPYITMFPRHIDEEYDGVYDVDGRNSGSWFAPRTAKAVWEILYAISNGDQFCGKTIVVIGRGETGNEIHSLLRALTNATLIQCNSMSELKKFTKKADVIISAAGADTIDKTMIKKGSILIDVGIRVVDGKVVGDINENVREIDCVVTPVPNGVGLVTRACLMRAVVQATNMAAE